MALDLHKKKHPFFIQPWNRGILATKVHVIKIFSNYHSGSLEESWQRRMIQYQTIHWNRVIYQGLWRTIHQKKHCIKQSKKTDVFCSHSWILNTHHCQNPQFPLRLVISRNHWSHELLIPENVSVTNLYHKYEQQWKNPGPTSNFPWWIKARKICPSCFFNTLL